MSRHISALFAWLLAPCALAASTGPSAWDVPRYVVFGSQDFAWNLMEVHSRQITRLKVPKPYKPIEMAASDDGRRIAFTAFDKTADNTLLFLWAPGDSDGAKSIGDTRGYHSFPAFSSDARWVYFSHNPNANGPPENHNQQAFAQIYRTHTDGTGLEALTHEPGCHIAPVAGAKSELFFVHSSCRHADRNLSLFDTVSLQERALPMPVGRLGFTTVSPDKKRLLIQVLDKNKVSFWERTSPDSIPHKRGDLMTGGDERAYYGRSAQELLIQSHATVFARMGNQSTEVFRFGLETP